MIGFYNRSVWLTYLGLASSVWGVTLASRGLVPPALLCLLFSGLCDMFDGKIARATKRNAEEKLFGIQIDSLCDLVCFGVLPSVLCFYEGVGGFFGVAVAVLFTLAAVIRLGFFNVTEQARQAETDANRESYRGLPVTSSAILIPLVFIFRRLLADAFPVVLTVYMFIVAALFVLDFRLKKPRGAGVFVVLAIGVAVAVCCIVMCVTGSI